MKIMKIVNKIPLLVLLGLTALTIINVEASVSVKIDVENKSNETLRLHLGGANPCYPCECIERSKYKLYNIEPGQTLKTEEQFADEDVAYGLRYCEDWYMLGSVFQTHERNVNQCSANLKMSTGNGELKVTLTPLETKE